MCELLGKNSRGKNGPIKNSFETNDTASYNADARNTNTTTYKEVTYFKMVNAAAEKVQPGLTVNMRNNTAIESR